MVQQRSALTTAGSDIWRPDDNHSVETIENSIREQRGKNVDRPDILDAIDASINALSDELRTLSLDIHGECRTIS